METNTVMGTVFGVFGEITTWIGNSVGTISELFYSNGDLTFIGTLGVVGLGFGAVFGLVRLIRSFLR